MHERRRCLTILLLGFIWLYVFMMSHVLFRVNLYSIVSWMSRNTLLETGAVSSWVFVYELSGCGLESRCSRYGLFLTIFLTQRRVTFFVLYFFPRDLEGRCFSLPNPWFSTEACLMVSVILYYILRMKA